MKKKTLCIVFGGQSNEHEIACLSAANIASLIDKDKWNLILIGITKEGRWLNVDSIDSIRDLSWEKSKKMAWILPDAKRHGMLVLNRADQETGSFIEEIGEVDKEYINLSEKSLKLDGKVLKVSGEFIYLDAVFPVLHGKYGEDGTIQGLLELSGIPYVGCGVFSSSASMDKFYTKIVVENLGIRQADFLGVSLADILSDEDMQKTLDKIEKKFCYPLFIKPSRSGSSVGVSKVFDRSSLKSGLKVAAAVDSKILVEKFVDGRELECAVFGGGKSKVVSSGIGEILAADVFYDYDAKYHNPKSRTVIDPVLPDGAAEKIRKYARDIFIALDGFGMARVDFFMDRTTNEVIFNEINTIPGFTSISMYPMLWEARGISKTELIEKLIENAFERELV